MIKAEKTFKYHIKSSILIFILGVATTFLFCDDCISNFEVGWKIMLFSGVLWVVLWKGNEWLTTYPDRFFPWQEEPSKRFFTGIVAHILYSLLASYFLDQIFEFIFFGRFEAFSFKSLVSYNLTAVIIALIISLFFTARDFLFAWRDLAIENEKLKVESISSKFASLKAQINPHFLFNSLNVLSGLVYKDPDLSAQFIQKLAEVYRYVLDRQEEELVPIEDELTFIQSIIFLQRIRFGENLHLDNRIPAESKFLIPPMALQMLIENSIKHNIITKEQPLKIEITVVDDFIVVSNNLQKKKIMSDSLGIGLENIQKRYRFLSKKEVEIMEEEKEFIVKLPIIKAA